MTYTPTILTLALDSVGHILIIMVTSPLHTCYASIYLPRSNRHGLYPP